MSAAKKVKLGHSESGLALGVRDSLYWEMSFELSPE